MGSKISKASHVNANKYNVCFPGGEGGGGHLGDR